jgi:hypothetical protein
MSSGTAATQEHAATHEHDPAPQDEPVVEDGPAPHPDPRLAMRGRILPSTGNPAGYPPYELSKMAGYTNRQIRYYLQTHQVADVPAFVKAKSRRDDILVTCGGDGNISKLPTIQPIIIPIIIHPPSHRNIPLRMMVSLMRNSLALFLERKA